MGETQYYLGCELAKVSIQSFVLELWRDLLT